MERIDLYNSDRSIFKPTHFVKMILLKNEQERPFLSKISTNQVEIEFAFDISICILPGREGQNQMNDTNRRCIYFLHVQQNGLPK